MTTKKGTRHPFAYGIPGYAIEISLDDKTKDIFFAMTADERKKWCEEQIKNGNTKIQRIGNHDN